jgi:hypothetical protein
MGLIARGKVQGGTIVFVQPLSLPDGTEVQVHIEPVVAGQAAERRAVRDFASLPIFGMWAGRGDQQASAAWVHRERQQWHTRAVRPD